MTEHGGSRVAFADLVLTQMLEPMIAGIEGEDGPITGLRAEVCVGSERLDAFRRMPWYVRVHHAWDLAEDDQQLVWAMISTSRETLEFAVGTSVIDIGALNQQMGELADYLEDWLSESDVAWGQRCTVPCPVVPSSASWY